MLQRAMRACGQRFGLPTMLLGYLLLCFATPGFAMPAGAGKATTQASANNTQVELEGELEVLHEDDFKNRKSSTRHILKTESGKRYELKLKDQTLRYPTGTKLHVKGTKSGNLFYLDTSGSSTQILSLAATPNTTGEQKVAVIMVNFSDNTAQPFTPSQVNSAFFGTTNSSTSFFKENSFGQTWLSGTVLGWYTLPISSSSPSYTIATYAQQAAKSAGIDLTAYNRYVYVFPQLSAIQWSGMATVGSNSSEVWLNGTIDVSTVSHELGHTLGLDHAKFLSCGTVSLASNCSSNEYGDPSDDMGAYSWGHYNAFHKEQLGWLGSVGMPPITTITTDGNYTLAPYETADSQPKALKILKSIDPSTGARTWYYLEYRQPIGFDTVLPTLMSATYNNLTLGVQVRLGTEGDIGSSYLLDMTAGSFLGQYDSTLLPGQSYTDNDAGIVITTLSADASGATVSIRLASKPQSSCVRANPSVLMSPSQSTSVAPGTTVSYTVAITNNDSTACSASAFNLKSSVPSGWLGSLAYSSLTISPGSTTSTTLSVTSATSAVTGSYSVGTTATNAAATVYNANGAATYSITSSTSPTKGGGKGRLK